MSFWVNRSSPAAAGNMVDEQQVLQIKHLNMSLAHALWNDTKKHFLFWRPNQQDVISLSLAKPLQIIAES